MAERVVTTGRSQNFRGAVWRTHWREIAATDWILSLRTSGRYHRGLDLFPPAKTWPALYTSLEPQVAVWEMVRRSAARNLVFLRNNVLSELEIDLGRVLDLGDPATVGLTWADLTSLDTRVCQEIAAAAQTHGYQGLLVPSAAMRGLNLIILPRNLSDPLPVRVVGSDELSLETLAQNRPDKSAGTVP